MDFPTQRYQQAGASPEELAELEQRFDALSPEAQQDYLDSIAGLASYDLAEQLQTLRDPVERESEQEAAQASATASPSVAADAGSVPAAADAGAKPDAATTGK